MKVLDDAGFFGSNGEDMFEDMCGRYDTDGRTQRRADGIVRILRVYSLMYGDTHTHYSPVLSCRRSC